VGDTKQKQKNQYTFFRLQGKKKVVTLFLCSIPAALQNRYAAEYVVSIFQTQIAPIRQCGGRRFFKSSKNPRVNFHKKRLGGYPLGYHII
jgi:hypothetical protein